LIEPLTANDVDSVNTGKVSLGVQGDCPEAGNEEQAAISRIVQHFKDVRTHANLFVTQTHQPLIGLCAIKKSIRE
jgi:hypothetical protein